MMPASGTTRRAGTAPVTVVPMANDPVLPPTTQGNELPRARRFVFGERIETTAPNLPDVLVEAQHRRDGMGSRPAKMSPAGIRAAAASRSMRRWSAIYFRPARAKESRTGRPVAGRWPKSGDPLLSEVGYGV